VSNPTQDPFGSKPFGGDPFGGAAFGQAAPGGPPVFNAPPAPPSPAGAEANTLATLSVIFAFVFAPAGAVLGHLGLSQIARTGQRGRDRALVGLTLSYVVIAVAVASLVWVTVTDNGSRRQIAAPAPSAPPAAASATTTTTMTTPPPPPPVAPADLAGLLPTVDDDKRITGNGNLTLRDTATQMNPDPGAVDNEHCWSALLLDSSHHYAVPAVTGVFATDIKDLSDPSAHPYDVQQSVAAFHDAAAAQHQLAALTDEWRRCGGATVLNTQSTGKQITYAFTTPIVESNGVATIECSQRYPVVPDPPLRIARAVAAKNNVVVDVAVSFRQGDNSQHDIALAIATLVLDKIPGPR